MTNPLRQQFAHLLRVDVEVPASKKAEVELLHQRALALMEAMARLLDMESRISQSMIAAVACAAREATRAAIETKVRAVGGEQILESRDNVTAGKSDIIDRALARAGDFLTSR